METEVEAKWLDIDVEELRKKLLAVGAELVFPKRLFTRKVYDYSDKALSKKGAWVRVRDEGDKITMSYKQLDDRSLHGTKEVNVIVNNFEAACSMLEALGLTSYAYQETKRESWKLDDAEIEIDTWPWIPTFVEIEAKSEESVKNAAKKLELNFADALFGSSEPAYMAVYDVTEEEVSSWPEIRFSKVPDWLLEKKKTINDSSE